MNVVGNTKADRNTCHTHCCKSTARATLRWLSSTVTGLCSGLHTTSAEEEGLVGTSASFSRGEDPTNTSNPITRRLAIDFLFASILSQASLVRLDANKKPDQKMIGFVLFVRRKRDSNPRYLAVQRFSRPPHSTTLPFLRARN